jgi:hypothetical protein
MAGVSDTNPTPPPTGDPAPSTPSPGERRLAHPPSDRYRTVADTSTPPATIADPAASIPRGVAIATVVAILGAIAIVVLGGVLAVTLGLVVVAGATGWGIAMALRFGAGDRLTRRRRWVSAVVLSITAVALGQLGLWQYARTEGGVLSPFDYLGEVYGPLVPLQFGVAVILAWLTAR